MREAGLLEECGFWFTVPVAVTRTNSDLVPYTARLHQKCEVDSTQSSLTMILPTDCCAANRLIVERRSLRLMISNPEKVKPRIGVPRHGNLIGSPNFYF